MRRPISLKHAFRLVVLPAMLAMAASCAASATGLRSSDFDDLGPIDTIGTGVEVGEPAGMIVSEGQLWVTDQRCSSFSRWSTAGVRTLNITTFGVAGTFANL